MLSGMYTCFLCSCIGGKRGLFPIPYEWIFENSLRPRSASKICHSPARASKTAMKSASLCPQSEGDISLFINDPLKLGKLCGVFFFAHANYMEFSCTAVPWWETRDSGTVGMSPGARLSCCSVSDTPGSSRRQPLCELRQASNKLYTKFYSSASLCLARQMIVTQRQVN